MGTRRTERAFAGLWLAVLVLLTVGRVEGQPSVGVLNPHTTVCAIAECQNARPLISGFDSSSVFTPGGKFVLQGKNFNSADGQPGTIVLKIGSRPGVQITYLGQQGFRQPYVERPSAVLGWADGHVFGQIPADISGVMDGPATLEVVRDDGMRSDPFTIKFKATQDVEILPMSDLTVQTCKPDADANLCNQWSDSKAISLPTNFPYPLSIYGRHFFFLTAKQVVNSTDYFAYSLQNGWQLKGEDSKYWFDHDCPTHCSSNSNMIQHYGGGAKGSIEIQWVADCDVEYMMVFQVSGPLGVPWK